MRSGGLVCALLVLAWSERGHAAPPARDDERDLTPTARELSDRGLRQYQAGELDAAIESFMGAFALSDNTGLLFNVAQAYRLKGDCALAKEYYRRFMDAAPSSNLKPTVERRVAEMESCIQVAKTTPATVALPGPSQPPQAIPPPTTTAIVSPRAPTTSSRRYAVTWTLRGSAAALLASSAVFGALSWDARQDRNNATTMRAEAEAIDRYEIRTALFWSFAATGVACAVISYFVGRAR